MGGGGSVYDRDTSDGYARNASGVSLEAAEVMRRTTSLNAALDPKDRRLVSRARSPVVLQYDVTGSMQNGPMIFRDKAPLVAGQIQLNELLDNPEIAVVAVGDARSDRAPFQVGNFSALRKMDDTLDRVYVEGNGGGGDSCESYEMMAWFLSQRCDLPNAEMPFCIIFGDEGFREDLFQNELKEHFGGQCGDVSAKQVFDDLKKKFKGNVFLVHRKYGGDDAKIVRQWEDVLGADHVIRLSSDRAIGDTIIGIIAIMSGKWTLDEYCKSMVTKREKPQTQTRIAEVRASLEPLMAIRPKTAPKSRVAAKSEKKGGETTPTPDAKPKRKAAKANRPAPAKKPGRL